MSFWDMSGAVGGLTWFYLSGNYGAFESSILGASASVWAPFLFKMEQQEKQRSRCQIRVVLLQNEQVRWQDLDEKVAAGGWRMEEAGESVKCLFAPWWSLGGKPTSQQQNARTRVAAAWFDFTHFISNGTILFRGPDVWKTFPPL